MSGACFGEEGERSSAEDACVVLKVVRVNEDMRLLAIIPTPSIVSLNDHRAFDSATVPESIVDELDLRVVRVDEDHCFNHKPF